MHELGHQRQSEMFGPLYLLIVGLPSIIRARIWVGRKLPPLDYYKGWPENQADKLGGVERK
jgi:hypothetical protein